MKKLLIVANMPSDNTKMLANSVLNGAQHPDIENVAVQLHHPLDANAESVLEADGIVIGSTENFGAMSGLIKDFFERIYYPCLEPKQGLPYALYIRAGNDGTGTKTGIEKIILGLRWRPVHDCLVLKGEYQSEFAEQCEVLGMHMAAGLDASVF